MRKTMLAAAAALGCWMPAVSGADRYDCPAAKLASGKPAPAQSLDLYDGPPAELAQLAPDNADAPLRQARFWSFSGKEQAVWVVCHYKGMKRTSSFTLPRAYAKCTVAGEKKLWSGLSCE
ncbi:MAG TPA: STY0301 family protein [Nevskia sp.]|nr:STY0301 family protein [Nevskia sp.]